LLSPPVYQVATILQSEAYPVLTSELEPHTAMGSRNPPPPPSGSEALPALPGASSGGACWEPPKRSRLPPWAARAALAFLEDARTALEPEAEPSDGALSEADAVSKAEAGARADGSAALAPRGPERRGRGAGAKGASTVAGVVASSEGITGLVSAIS
jgi:hypothetical protein